jgi:hypothetical protein
VLKNEIHLNVQLGQGDTQLRGSYFSCDYYQVFPESLKQKGFRTIQTGKRKEQLIRNSSFLKAFIMGQTESLLDQEFRDYSNETYRTFMRDNFEKPAKDYYELNFKPFNSPLNKVLRDNFPDCLNVLLNLGANLLGSRTAEQKSIENLNIISLRAISTTSVFRCMGTYPQAIDCFLHCMDHIKQNNLLEECQHLFETNPLFQLYIRQIAEVIALSSKRSSIFLASQCNTLEGRDLFLHILFHIQEAEKMIEVISKTSFDDFFEENMLRKIDLEKEVQFMRLKMILAFIKNKEIDVQYILNNFENIKSSSDNSDDINAFLQLSVGMSSGFSFA